MTAKNVTLADLRVILQSIVISFEITCGTDRGAVGEPTGLRMTSSDREAITVPRARRGARATEMACLVLHGLGGGPYELQPLIAALEAVEVRVLAPIMPGHEGPGPVMPRSSWRDWLATAESAFDLLAAGGREVAVIGFSTGGTLALYLASERPVARQVLLAPFLAIRYSGLIPIRPASYLRRLAQVMPNLPRRASGSP